MNRLFSIFTGATIFLSLALSGCNDALLGENGQITFEDNTPNPGFDLMPQQVDAPMAVGSRLRLTVGATGLKATDVTSGAPDTISIVSVEEVLSDDEEPIHTVVELKAHQTGSAKINVTTELGETDRIEVNAEVPTQGTISMFPWNASLPLAVNVLGGGIVLLPNSRITVHAQLRDLNDNELTGFAAQEWVLESDGGSTITPSEHSDFGTFSSGEQIGISTLRFGRFGATELETIPADAVARIEIVDGLTGVPLEGLQIGGEQDAPLFLHAALYTQDGRYVAGIDGDPVTFESTRNVQLGSLISAEGEMDAEADEPFRPYVQGRATDLKILQAGTHRVTATWKGLSVSAEFIVTELSASSAE